MPRRTLRYWLKHLTPFQVAIHLESTDERIPATTSQTFDALVSGDFNNFVLAVVQFQGREVPVICTLEPVGHGDNFEVIPLFLAVTDEMDLRLDGEPLITHVPNPPPHPLDP